MRLQTAVTTLTALALAACSTEVPPEYGTLESSSEALTSNAQRLASIPRTKLLKPASAIQDQYIVVLNDDVAGLQSIAVEQAATIGAQVLRTYGTALNGYVMRGPESAALRLLDDPRVKYVEQDAVFSINETQANPTWGLDRSDQRWLPLDQSYTYNVDGSGVTVYVIDTGIRITHEEFGGRASHGFTSVEDGNGANDCHGHGTHVSGTVGGTTYGMAKNASLVAVRVLSCQGGGTLSGVIAGIDWVTANRVLPAVANMSLGGPATQSLDDALASSVDSGVVYAVAGGNSSTDACQFSPARAPAAITAGALNNIGDSRAFFSNYGTCLDVFAPGVGVTSAWADSDTATAVLSGTSMASPHVAGAAALYLSAHPTATAAEVTDALLSQATPGMVIDPGAGSPNLLLYSKFIGGGGGGDTTPPTISIIAPSEGQEVTGPVNLSALASDDVGVAVVFFIVDGAIVSAAPTPPYEGLWDASNASNGPHVIMARAFDDAGNLGSSAPVTVIVNNPGAATYDPILKAPKCATLGSICDTQSLVDGRGPLGPELHAPNTINDSCADGELGTYHFDESLDRLRVFTIDGSVMAPGKTVGIVANVWAYFDPSIDALDVYHAADASSPSWTYITTLYPGYPGSQTLGVLFTLPEGGELQAVRGVFRYGGSANNCGDGPFDDRDDLVFAVRQPPTASFGYSCNGLPCSFTDTSTTQGGETIAARSWSFGDGSSSTDRNPSHTYASPGTYAVSLTVTDSGGLSDTTTKSIVVTGLPPVASFSASCGILSCSFTDQSTDPDSTIASWLWSFGNGYGSFLQNPNYTYAVAGTYVVSLTVTDSQGLSSTTMRTITVTPPPIIALGATGSKVKGKWVVDLTWSGATSTAVDVYRNGTLILHTPNDGTHRDSVDRSGTFTYKLCEPGTNYCSNIVTVVL